MQFLSHFKRSFTSIKSEGSFAIFQLFRYRAISLFVPRTNFKEFFRQMERTRSKNDSIGRNCNKSIVHRIEGYYVSRKGGSRKKHRSWKLYIYIYTKWRHGTRHLSDSSWTTLADIALFPRVIRHRSHPHHRQNSPYG